MKLRFYRNSIRFRLSQSEVAELDQKGFLSERISFHSTPPGKMIYSLEQTTAGAIRTSFSAQELRVLIPQPTIKQWANNREEVGIYTELDLNGENRLQVTIEKDFKCLVDRPGEEEGDLYPNPARH